MELLLKNANIVTDKETYMSDIYIKDGVIVNIDKKIEIPGVKTVDIGGKYLVPGFVSFQISQVSTVPKSSSPRPALSLAPGT